MAARRKYNSAQRRTDLADAAIDLLGTHGSRGLTHPRVDKHAGLPPGTTSYYFRTRKALLQGVAARLTDLDRADLSMMDELNEDHTHGYSGTRGLAELVMLSGTEPYLTRTRARFELLLQSRDDPDLGATMRDYGIEFYGLACRAIAHWYNDPDLPEAHIHERAVVVLTFVSGVMTSFVHGYPAVVDAAQLDELIRQILHCRQGNISGSMVGKVPGGPGR